MSRRTRELLKENNELEKQIKLEDRQILTDIVVYIRSANISPYYQEMVRRDIWQMLLDGETMGMTADEVIGGDHRAFCDQVIRELPHLSGRERFLSSLRDVLLSVVVLMVIWLCFGMFDQLSGTGSLPYFEVTAGNVISTVLILITAFSVYRVISRNAFDSGVLKSKKAILLFWAAMILCIGANCLIRYPLLQIHGIAVIVGIVVLAVVYKVLDLKVD